MFFFAAPSGIDLEICNCISSTLPPITRSSPSRPHCPFPTSCIRHAFFNGSRLLRDFPPQGSPVFREVRGGEHLLVSEHHGEPWDTCLWLDGNAHRPAQRFILCKSLEISAVARCMSLASSQCSRRRVAARCRRKAQVKQAHGEAGNDAIQTRPLPVTSNCPGVGPRRLTRCRVSHQWRRAHPPSQLQPQITSRQYSISNAPPISLAVPGIPHSTAMAGPRRVGPSTSISTTTTTTTCSVLTKTAAARLQRPLRIVPRLGRPLMARTGIASLMLQPRSGSSGHRLHIVGRRSSCRSPTLSPVRTLMRIGL